jgi:signal transduction histidine kinase
MAAAQLLLVEQEDPIRALLQKLLRHEGFVVAAFARPADALEHVRRGFVPQLVVANPETDVGRELMAALEQHPLLSTVPLCDSAGDVARIADRAREILAASPEGPSEYDLVDFVAANYSAMAARLPGMLEKLRQLAQMAGNYPEIKDAIEQATRGGRRMRSYARYLRDYGHAAGAARALTDVRAALDFALETADHQITSRATLVRDIGPLPPVMAHERPLSHVFLSLLVNAAQAIGDGAPGKNVIRVSARTDENGWAVIEVSDSGSGIPPELTPQIFEPYFSTKRGAGLGLGLYLSRVALSAWGGTIACVATEPGKGSTFRVELPPAAPRSLS